MDGPALEHSDSDSGESWTLLESSPALADEAPDFTETRAESPVPETHEKDEDTDGISIITDSDHESPSPYQMNYENFLPEDIHPNDPEISKYVSINSPLTHLNDTNESLRVEDDFLGDSNGKHRIYVHKRNKRLSTVLNIIMLGSVITAAGVAIGHMWGAKNDCSINTTPTVNKILSNLYKLQEENAYLRSKIKELSSFYQSQQKPYKQNRCKKMFEEPLNNKNANILTKCVDDKVDKLENHFVEPIYEKEFGTDVTKLKNVYKENKGWLDEEILKRLKVEELMWGKNIVKYVKANEKIENNKMSDSDNNESMLKLVKDENTILQDMPEKEPNNLNKISYADSLKSKQQIKKLNKREINKEFENESDKYHVKKKLKGNHEKDPEYPVSEEEIKKDDRYIGHKNKKEKKKNERHKSHKKQKRQNKYEQWEMKGGLIKDYDDLSFSSQDDEVLFNNSEQVSLNDSKKSTNDNLNKYTEADNTEHGVKSHLKKKEKINKKESRKHEDWYEKRTSLRDEARKQLEHELFGEMAPNTARWYFKRMLKREQCRNKDNSTNRKVFNKRDMNYKLKH